MSASLQHSSYWQCKLQLEKKGLGELSCWESSENCVHLATYMLGDNVYLYSTERERDLQSHLLSKIPSFESAGQSKLKL